MAESGAVVHVGENSPEHVAYQLFCHVAAVEGVLLGRLQKDATSRKWILDTYSDCLHAVRNPHLRAGGQEPGETLS